MYVNRLQWHNKPLTISTSCHVNNRLALMGMWSVTVRVHFQTRKCSLEHTSISRLTSSFNCWTTPSRLSAGISPMYSAIEQRNPWFVVHFSHTFQSQLTNIWSTGKVVPLQTDRTPFTSDVLRCPSSKLLLLLTHTYTHAYAHILTCAHTSTRAHTP